MTHKESIELFKKLGVKHTPELKEPLVKMPYMGEFTLEMYAQQIIDEYKEAGVDPDTVWAQSFDLKVVEYWTDKDPRFGNQAVFLDGRYDDLSFDHTNLDTWDPDMKTLYTNGVRILAPPMWMLVKDEGGKIAPSTYAKAATMAGLHIITWTLERSGLLKDLEDDEFYYQTLPNIIYNDGDMMEVLDVLAQEVEVIGIFSDWPATVTYYANCFGL